MYPLLSRFFISGYMFYIHVLYIFYNVSTYTLYIHVFIYMYIQAASVVQLAEHWTSNPVVTGSNPVRGSSVFFSLSAFRLCLTLSCLPLHIHVQDLIMYFNGHIRMYMYNTH